MSCGICWGDFTDSDLIYETNCKPVSHKFHIECLQISHKLNGQKECPYCRQPLNISNYKNLTPKCKYILVRGANKGKQCSKLGTHPGGYCHLHKTKCIQESNGGAAGSEDETTENVNKKYVLTDGPRCDAICKTGKKCKNRKKGDTYFCGIHKDITIEILSHE
jgi:hypothetical protein